MRAIIVSDIHSNVEALRSVIADADANGGFDELWSLGDLVGYGPDPGECIDLLNQYEHRGVAGNHDLAAIGEMSVESFNSHATAAVAWTASQLTYSHAEYLRGLPRRIEIDGFTMVHGSPRFPETEYILTPEVADANFAYFDTPTCLVGHSHKAFVCRGSKEGAVFEAFPANGPVDVGRDRMIINPGAVGQPRDRDPRASYAAYDSDAQQMSHHRAAYEVPITQDKMTERGLPEYLIQRLAYGV